VDGDAAWLARLCSGLGVLTVNVALVTLAGNVTLDGCVSTNVYQWINASWWVAVYRSVPAYQSAAAS